MHLSCCSQFLRLGPGLTVESIGRICCQRPLPCQHDAGQTVRHHDALGARAVVSQTHRPHYVFLHHPLGLYVDCPRPFAVRPAHSVGLHCRPVFPASMYAWGKSTDVD